MIIKFFVDDDVKYSSEFVSFTTTDTLFDIPKDLKKMNNLCRAIAVLRGHPRNCGIEKITITKR